MDVTTEKPKYNVPVVTSFFRYNASAMTASAVDFGLAIFCKEILGIYYVLATFIGAISGGIVAFLLGRNWTYLSKEEKPQTQGLKYALVWCGSIFLNTYGVYFFTEFIGVDEKHFAFTRILTASIVGAFYNFPLQRYFVFK